MGGWMRAEGAVPGTLKQQSGGLHAFECMPSQWALHWFSPSRLADACRGSSGEQHQAGAAPAPDTLLSLNLSITAWGSSSF